MNKIDGFIELLIDLTNKDKIVWKEVKKKMCLKREVESYLMKQVSRSLK